MPPHVAVVEGRAVLVREAAAEPLVEGMPLVVGDRLETADGRAEVLFGDGGAIAIDRDTRLELLADALIRVFAGRLRLQVPRAARSEVASYRVDTPAAVVQIEAPGDYLIAIDDRDALETRVALARGIARVTNDHGAVRLQAGEQTIVGLDRAPAAPQIFNAAVGDDFDRWAYERQAERVGAPPASYLPTEIRPYASTLDRYGVWMQDMSYGLIWQPYAGTGWKPYWNGAWRYIGPLGWTWIGFDAWTWPTHYFGRWTYMPGRGWCWIPTARWGPAWVAWAAAPGYVAWCPLGLDGRPVIAVSQFGTLNIYQANGIYDANGIFDANGAYDPWVGWTAAPSHAFRRRTVAVTTVDRVTTTARPPFTSAATSPARPGDAAPSIPLRSPGSRIGDAVAWRSMPPSGAAVGSFFTRTAPPWTGRPDRGRWDDARQAAPPTWRESSRPQGGAVAAARSSVEPGREIAMPRWPGRLAPSGRTIGAPHQASPPEAMTPGGVIPERGPSPAAAPRGGGVPYRMVGPFRMPSPGAVPSGVAVPRGSMGPGLVPAPTVVPAMPPIVPPAVPPR